jgi:hypothetical protein
MPEVKEVKKPELSKEDLQSLIAIVASHPTPQGVGSQEGQYKIQLVQKLQELLK